MFTISDLQINTLVSIFAWPFARIVGLFLAEPLFAYRGVPRRFKAGFALLLTVLIVPLLPPLPAVPVMSVGSLAILIQQLLIGLSMGFVMRLTLSAVEMAGFIMGSQTGLGFAMFFDPLHAAQVPVLSQFFSLFVFLIFLTFDGQQVILATLVQSFKILPIGMPMPEEGIKTLVIWGSHILKWGVWLSLPVIASLLVTNLAIGVMTRAAPQFNIFSFGFPLTLTIGFVTIYLSIPLMVPLIENMYQDAFDFILAMLKLK